MNRFHWLRDTSFADQEKLLLMQGDVRLYDGDSKTSYDLGDLILTSTRILWRDSDQPSHDLCMPLSLITETEEERASFMKSAKIIVHLSEVKSTEKLKRPVKSSPNNHVKFSFRSGGCLPFLAALNEALYQRVWDDIASSMSQGKKFRTGIAGIERQMQARNEVTGENISVAFEDLTTLMGMAKNMVTLSKSISQKLKEKQGCISTDETIQFKSYLMSLGIPDPVTRDMYGSTFEQGLSRELVDILVKPLKESCGVLSLADAYCRVNRARGMELISPEDLLLACEYFRPAGSPLKLHTFDSGVSVIMLKSHDEESKIKETKKLLKENGSLTADELSAIIQIPVVLAKERLLTAEKNGSACRDDSAEGMRFYPNSFMIEQK